MSSLYNLAVNYGISDHSKTALEKFLDEKRPYFVTSLVSTKQKFFDF